MPYRDLREFVDALKAHDELRVVRGADWNVEIGTITELNFEREGPALLFDEITGYPAGYRVLTNAVDTLPRALLALELPVDLDLDAALDAYEKKLLGFRPVPPVHVDTGPVFENVFFGDDVDLWRFPTPKWHELDGGRYIGTGCAVFMRDPDSGQTNFGTYRVVVHDERHAGLFISPNKTGAIILRKYWAAGESCPVAVTMGQEILVYLGATQYFGQKRGVNKYDLVGHIRGEPVEVVREEITGLPIPATAEVVIAGGVPPPTVEARDEGPFGEFTGYYASGARPEPVIRVQALYHRRDPILLGVPPVKRRAHRDEFGLPTWAKNLQENFQKAGVEDVLGVWRLAIPGVTVVQIRQRYPGHAAKAALALAGEYMGRFVIVVDEDINPRDPLDVLWAIGTRCDPETALSIVRGGQSSPLDPRIPPDRKRQGDFTSSRAIIDACKPYHWIKDFPVTNVASPEARRRVLEKWTELF